MTMNGPLPDNISITNHDVKYTEQEMKVIIKNPMNEPSEKIPFRINKQTVIMTVHKLPAAKTVKYSVNNNPDTLIAIIQTIGDVIITLNKSANTAPDSCINRKSG